MTTYLILACLGGVCIGLLLAVVIWRWCRVPTMRELAAKHHIPLPSQEDGQLEVDRLTGRPFRDDILGVSKP